MLLRSLCSAALRLSRINGASLILIASAVVISASHIVVGDARAQTVPPRAVRRDIPITNAILWLLSDEASYSTASFIDVAGGR